MLADEHKPAHDSSMLAAGAFQPPRQPTRIEAVLIVSAGGLQAG